MKSSCEPCPGRRPPFCWQATRSAWRSWHNPGLSRESMPDMQFGMKTVVETNVWLRVGRVLGWVPGIITMVLAGVLFWITSITMHKYIMKHPQIKDICEWTRSVSAHGYFQPRTSFAHTDQCLTPRRFWILRVWPEQRGLCLLGFHASCQQYSSDRLPRSHGS